MHFINHFLNLFYIQFVSIDPGLSIGKPYARAHVNQDKHPKALLTPKTTV